MYCSYEPVIVSGNDIYKLINSNNNAYDTSNSKEILPYIIVSQAGGPVCL